MMELVIVHMLIVACNITTTRINMAVSDIHERKFVRCTTHNATVTCFFMYF